MKKRLTFRVAGVALGIAAATYFAFACSGGIPGGIGGPPFPFSGPSCSGSEFDQTCWDCIDVEGGPADCVSSQCVTYLTCFCACGATDVTCQTGCAAKKTSACNSCLDAIVVFEQQSCTALCRGGVIPEAGSDADASADGTIDGGPESGGDGSFDSAVEGGSETGTEGGADAGVEGHLDASSETSVDGAAEGSVDSGPGSEAAADSGTD